MTARVQSECFISGGSTGALPLSRGHWVVLAVLALVEIASALFLASINPAQGHDEAWYLLYARHIRGGPALPYQYFRPPMFPLLLAALGPYFRLVTGLAHIGSAALIFLILRRLVSRNMAIAGLAVFMVCGQLRMYNVLLLTEIPSILFLLLAIYAFMVRSPLLVGGALALAMMTSWGMAAVPPVVFLLYAARRQWRDCATFTAGFALVLMPFLIVFAIKYGSPLEPFLSNLRIQGGAPNDWWYYLRRPIWLPITLMVGSVAAAWHVWVNRRHWRVQPHYGLYVLLLGVILARQVLLQSISVKSSRFLAPVIPILLLLSMSMIWQYGRRWRTLQWALCGVLFLSVLPTKRMFYQVYGLANHPVHGIAKFSDSLAAFPVAEPIYTDLNDLAVMGQTAHPTVAVTGPGSSHRALVNRPFAARAEIPDGALYLTWDPGCGQILASNTVPRGQALWLVRWRRGAVAERNRLCPEGTAQLSATDIGLTPR